MGSYGYRGYTIATKIIKLEGEEVTIYQVFLNGTLIKDTLNSEGAAENFIDNITEPPSKPTAKTRKP